MQQCNVVKIYGRNTTFNHSRMHVGAMETENDGSNQTFLTGEHAEALNDVTSLLSQPREERLANLERFTRCITCKFRRRPSQEEEDLRKLMPDSLGRDPDVWEYTSCAICLCDFADGEELCRASCPGGHAFHPKCLRAWIERSHETCPVCRCKEGDRSKSGAGARFSADALAEYVTRRMRSSKVDFTVSQENQQLADQVMARIFLPMVCLKPAVEEEDDLPAPPKNLEQEPTLAEIFTARRLARQAERSPGSPRSPRVPTGRRPRKK